LANSKCHPVNMLLRDRHFSESTVIYKYLYTKFMYKYQLNFLIPDFFPVSDFRKLRFSQLKTLLGQLEKKEKKKLDSFPV